MYHHYYILLAVLIEHHKSIWLTIQVVGVLIQARDKAGGPISIN